MVVSELRLGNIVYGDDDLLSMNCIARIIRISEKEVTWKSIQENANKDTVQTDAIIDINPIELNEDWLLKFGIKETPLFFQKVFYADWIEIKYVHQLQNLYFALTGNELTLTPAKEEMK